MTLLSVSALPSGLSLAGSAAFQRREGLPDIGETTTTESALGQVLGGVLATLPSSAPVVIMVHGKGYCPGEPGLDPHSLIFAPRAGHGRSRNVSWPRRLGFALPGPHDPRGLCIGFGWDARGRLWRATDGADAVASHLAALITLIRHLDPQRRIDLIGHSLGARVILGAVPALEAGALGRVLLLAGADFTHRAAAALASPAGMGAEFLNITTRENDLYDFLFERAFSPLGRSGALGRGFHGHHNWLDIQIDHPETAVALRRLGLPLVAPRARICHWSVYLRPGVFRLYRRLLHDRETLTLGLLRAHLGAAPQPRWSRILDGWLSQRALAAISVRRSSASR